MQGPTWQQAVQWVAELRVSPGDELSVVCKHDTYGMSFALHDRDVYSQTASEAPHSMREEITAADAQGGELTAGNTALGLDGKVGSAASPSDAAVVGSSTNDGASSAACRPFEAAAESPAATGVPLKVTTACFYAQHIA